MKVGTIALALVLLLLGPGSLVLGASRPEAGKYAGTGAAAETNTRAHQVGVAAEAAVRNPGKRDPAVGRLAQHLVEKAGVRKGLCAVLGGDDGTLAAEIAQASEWLVHVWEPDGAAVKAAQEALAEAGLYGTRVLVEKGPLDRLPYADNLIDVVLCAELSDQDLADLSLAEVLRVLRPEGRAILGRARLGGQAELSSANLREWIQAPPFAQGKLAVVKADAFGLWAEVVKPVPDGMDEWSHWQHGPDNNPFSADTVIQAPYLTQFLALPYYSTMPSISVLAGGRVFRAAGHMAIHQREEPYLNTLYATNAYNGTLLWTRPIPEGFLVHRSIFVATPETLYLMGERECLLLDPETGAEQDRIVLPPQVGGGEAAEEGYWKWIALDGGVLYALLGGRDPEAEVIKRGRTQGAWGWDELSKGYYEAQYPWGYGQTLVALEPKTGKILWTHREEKPIDSRALCLANGRLFLHSEGAFVACLDQRSGQVLWKNEDPELLAAIAEPNDAGLGFKTTPYALCTDEGLYFGGRGRKNVVGVSAADGRLRWVVPGAYNATNLLFYDGHLYAHIPSCQKLNPRTGEAVQDLGLRKRSCARLTGCPDAFFHRGSLAEHGGEGTIRYPLASGQPTVIHAFRPPCNDGIIPAGGLLHVTPWDCDCNLQLMGHLALAPAGAFEFNREATEAERLEVAVDDLSGIAPFAASDRDWPTYRADNERSACTSAAMPGAAVRRWEFQPQTPFTPSPPTAAGGLIFLGGNDCQVRALDAATGQERWRFPTGGPIRLPPTIWRGRAYAGCNDGYVYALEAATGRLLWRFRAAPAERKITVFGELWSTWPVNSGVLVEDGVVYAAAGIIHYDGTHVYALDALTGQIQWQNNRSGHLNPDLRCGASVQGNLALVGRKLWLAGGNVTSPTAYDLADGRCLNPPPGPGWPAGPRGSEVGGLAGRYVLLGGRRLFTQDDDPITNWTAFEIFNAENGAKFEGAAFHGRVPPASGQGVIVMASRGPLVCLGSQKLDGWLQTKRTGVQLDERWRAESIQNCVAVALARNAVVAVGEPAGSPSPSEWMVQAFDLKNGRVLWTESLDSAPLPGGLCVDQDGQAIVVLKDGRVVGVGT